LQLNHLLVKRVLHDRRVKDCDGDKVFQQALLESFAEKLLSLFVDAVLFYEHLDDSFNKHARQDGGLLGQCASRKLVQYAHVASFLDSSVANRVDNLEPYLYSLFPWQRMETEEGVDRNELVLVDGRVLRLCIDAECLEHAVEHISVNQPLVD